MLLLIGINICPFILIPLVNNMLKTLHVVEIR